MHGIAKQDDSTQPPRGGSNMRGGQVPSPELLQSLEQFPDLPSPPYIASQIIELLKDPEADFKVLMELIAQDPALVAKILRTSNSATYARRREVTNMAQALLTLGQSATTMLALSFSLVSGLKDTGSQSTGFSLEFFWRRSLLAGSAARSLGLACGSDHAEELFLAGLLQDIGLMVLSMVKPNTYEVLVAREDDHQAIIQRENDLLGVDHAWIGGWLLERWDLPKLICHAVRRSHTVTAQDAQHEEDTEPETLAFLSCVALSGKIADVMLATRDDSAIAELALDISSSLELEQADILEVLDRLASQVPEIESQFGMQVLDAEKASSIVDRSRAMLTDLSMKLLREMCDLKTHTETLVEEKSRDALTGLYNREKLDLELEGWVERANNHGFPLALAFMDLDGFKRVNDDLGHHAGDAILKSTAALLSKQVRESDTLARFGGDEFVLLLGGERKADALIVCERILRAFASTTHAADGKVVDVQISIGLATLDMAPEKTAEELVRSADTALLSAKAAGKAQVVAFDEI